MTANITRDHMVGLWPAVMREDGCRVEIICPHGVGHPVEKLSNRWADWMGIHGCDGCCTTAAFAVVEGIHVNRKT